MKLYLFLLIILVLMGFSLVKGWSYTQLSGGTDLRCRIVGARLLQAGHSPYFYKWQKGDSERLLDPNDPPLRKVNGNVVTPATLIIVSPLAGIPYEKIRMAWTVLQYLLLLSALLLLLRYPVAKHKNDLIAAVITGVCFLFSSLWYYNIERGQVYTLYVFLIALVFAVYQCRWKYNQVAAGFINGLAVFIRPLTGVFFIVLLFKKDRRYLTGGAAGLLAGVLLFVLPAINQWQDYAAAMKEYSNEILFHTTGEQSPASDLPQVIEGVSNLRESVYFETMGFSTVQYYLAARNIEFSSLPLAAAYLFIALLLLFLFVRKKWVPVADDDWILIAFLLYITAEFFIVGFRGGYNLIEWIAGAMLIYRKGGFRALLPALLLVPLFLVVSFPHRYEIAELLLVALAGYICFFVPAEKTGSPNRGDAEAPGVI